MQAFTDMPSTSTVQAPQCEVSQPMCGPVCAYRLLKENPNPSEQQIRYGLAGNLCRCTGYQNIVKAVQSAAKKLAAAQTATA